MNALRYVTAHTITKDLALIRIASNGARPESYEFTDINKSLSVGLSIFGNSWGRESDVLGIATVMNRLSSSAKDYFAAGGLGIFVGDGQLQN